MYKHLNLHQKLIEVRKRISVTADKQGQSGAARFTYVSADQLVDAVYTLLDEYNILLFPSIPQQTTTVVSIAGKDGSVRNEFLTQSTMYYEITNADAPEQTLRIPWSTSATSTSAGHSFGSAISFAERYFLMKFFGIKSSGDHHNSDGHNQPRPQQNHNTLPIPKNATEASRILITFGKHKGKTLRDIFKQDVQYLQWLVKDERTQEAVKTGITLMFLAMEQHSQQQERTPQQ